MGLNPSLTAVLLFSLKAFGMSLRELEREFLLFLVLGVRPVAALVLWTVAVIIHVARSTRRCAGRLAACFICRRADGPKSFAWSFCCW